MILGVFHLRKQRAFRERSVPRAQELLVARALHKAHVRHRTDELFWALDPLALHQVRPELLGLLKALHDVRRLAHVDPAITRDRRVIELTERSVPGARVVARVGALGRDAIKLLDHRDTQRGIELVQEHRDRSAHDARAHQEHVVGSSFTHGLA